MDNSTVNSYPSAYLKATKAVTKYNDEYMMQYFNQMVQATKMYGKPKAKKLTMNFPTKKI